ncbi:MAG: DNRLRE domain-containing protein [Syntrophothermus sp.]
MYRKISFLLLMIILPVLLASCNDDPSSVGLNLLQNGDLIIIQPDSLPKPEVTPNVLDIVLEGGNPILLGKYKNTTAKMLVNFNIHISLDSINTVLQNNSRTVQSAWIEMTPKYKIGGESKISFNLFRIKSKWSITSRFNYDSLAVLAGKTEQVTSTYDTQLDSVYKVILNGQQVTGWLKDTSTDSLGLFFDPANTDNITGFQNIANSTSATVMKLKVVLNNPVSSTDTLTFLPVNSIHVVNKFQNISTIPANGIVLQGGTGLHARLKFQLPNLPAGTVINSAVLEMKYDSTQTDKGSQFFSTLDVRFLKDAEGKKPDSTATYSISLNGDVYSGEIGPLVQKWVSSKQQNNGLDLSIQNEEGTADKIFIRNDAQYWPKLKIIYTAKKP